MDGFFLADPESAESLFRRMKQCEQDLVDYARLKYSKNEAGMNGRVVKKHGSLVAMASSSSSGRSYQAQTLSSFAKSTKPVHNVVETKASFVATRGQLSPPVRDNPGRAYRTTRDNYHSVRTNGYVEIPESEDNAPEIEPNKLCRELSQVTSRLSGIVGHIEDDGLRSKVSQFCDDIGGYVSKEQLRHAGGHESISDVCTLGTANSCFKRLERMVDEAVAPLEEENRQLNRKVSKLEADLRLSEESDREKRQLVKDLQGCVEELKAENAKLAEDKKSKYTKLQRELETLKQENAAMKDDNARIKQELKSVLASNSTLEHRLKQRDTDVEEMKSSFRSLLGMLVSCLETTPNQPNADVLSAVCSSVSQLSVPKSIKTTGSKGEGRERGSSFKVQVVRPSGSPAPGDEIPVKDKAAVASQTNYHSFIETARAASEPKKKPSRFNKNTEPASSKPSLSTVVSSRAVTETYEADEEYDSDSEMAPSECDFHHATEFQEKLENLGHHLKNLQGRLD